MKKKFIVGIIVAILAFMPNNHFVFAYNNIPPHNLSIWTQVQLLAEEKLATLESYDNISDSMMPIKLPNHVITCDCCMKTIKPSSMHVVSTSELGIITRVDISGETSGASGLAPSPNNYPLIRASGEPQSISEEQTNISIIPRTYRSLIHAPAELPSSELESILEERTHLLDALLRYTDDLNVFPKLHNTDNLSPECELDIVISLPCHVFICENNIKYILSSYVKDIIQTELGPITIVTHSLVFAPVQVDLYVANSYGHNISSNSFWKTAWNGHYYVFQGNMIAYVEIAIGGRLVLAPDGRPTVAPEDLATLLVAYSWEPNIVAFFNYSVVRIQLGLQHFPGFPFYVIAHGEYQVAFHGGFATRQHISVVLSP